MEEAVEPLRGLNIDRTVWIWTEQHKKAFVQRDGFPGPRGTDEAWTPSLGRVAVQRELRDDEGRAAYVAESKIHLVVAVRKYPQAHHLVRHPQQLSLAVGVGEADQEQESAVDAPNVRPGGRAPNKSV